MLRKVLFVAGLMLAALLSVACDDKIKISDKDIRQIQYVQLRAMLDDPKAPTVLVDPRPPAIYAQGHIDGASSIPLPQLVANDPTLANAVNIVVYGTTWTDYLSPAAAKKLMAMGYRNVFDFRGGIDDWKSEGGKVVTGTPATQLSTPGN